MTPTPPATIKAFSPEEVAARIADFGGLLHACVTAGASVNFVMPFTQDDARAFWRDKVLPPLRAGTRTVLAAQVDGRLAGSVQLSTDTPPNQPHRGEVTKLLVHPDFRCRGIARSLMVALEALAREKGRRLITFDTTTGGAAEPLYTSLGYISVGVIPDYSLHALERPATLKPRP